MVFEMYPEVGIRDSVDDIKFERFLSGRRDWNARQY